MVLSVRCTTFCRIFDYCCKRSRNLKKETQSIFRSQAECTKEEILVHSLSFLMNELYMKTFELIFCIFFSNHSCYQSRQIDLQNMRGNILGSCLRQGIKYFGANWFILCLREARDGDRHGDHLAVMDPFAPLRNIPLPLYLSISSTVFTKLPLSTTHK